MTSFYLKLIKTRLLLWKLLNNKRVIPLIRMRWKWMIKHFWLKGLKTFYSLERVRTSTKPIELLSYQRMNLVRGLRVGKNRTIKSSSIISVLVMDMSRLNAQIIWNQTVRIWMPPRVVMSIRAMSLTRLVWIERDGGRVEGSLISSSGQLYSTLLPSPSIQTNLRWTNMITMTTTPSIQTSH